jgi:DNA-binding transcriptional LysR family regulator
MDERIARRLKLRDLYTLQAVMQCGSMAKAAEHLAVSQPAISKAITEIERTLGVPLFDRTARGVTPTAYGQALLRRGHSILDELRESIKDIEFLSDPTAGELRVGTAEPMTAFVATVIDRVSRQHPRIQFHVTAGDTPKLYGELRERSIDLRIKRMADPKPEPDMNAETLFYDPLRVVAAKQSPWFRRRSVELADLMDEPWVLTPDPFLMSLVVEAFGANNLDLPRATVTSLSLQVRINLLTTGRFLGLAPAAMLELPVPHPVLKALAVKLPTTRRPIAAVTLKKRALSPLGQLFIQTARAVAKPLAGR